MLGATSWRSHSFCRGGATVLFSAGFPVQDIAVYGRWSTLSSCRLYLASGEQEVLGLPQARSTASRERIAAFAALASRVFDVEIVGVPAGLEGYVFCHHQSHFMKASSASQF